jgi:hypothetical protein
MLRAGEARCAITPMNGVTVGYVSRNGKETVRSRTISQERARALKFAQSICLGIVARDTLVGWESL